ncbi:hypothetical protein Golax_025336 [Gossypium laxum]|uniref:Uncharacterized protein n=1 Tax=Gossypium laxum TaxID=34288 RepID=A0A7J9B4L9_9ROSI|nr:hypothetical protein [Gossypium laxum]
MGKASGDRHLLLFAFFVYELVVFPKTLGYGSVELANFLFQIEKGVNPAPTVLAKTIISLNFINRKGNRGFLGCAQPRNKMEGSMDDSKQNTYQVQWSFVGSLN